jgi:hypothetical protein
LEMAAADNEDPCSVSGNRLIASKALYIVLASLWLFSATDLCHAQSSLQSGAAVRRLPPVSLDEIPVEELPTPVGPRAAADRWSLPLEEMEQGIDLGRPEGGNFLQSSEPISLPLVLPPVQIGWVPLNYNVPLLVQQSEYAWDTHLPPEGPLPGLGIDALVRGAYLNNQRIEWSGQEDTFIAEAIIGATLRQIHMEWETTIRGEFYLNQPFDRNRYLTPERESYLDNFEVDIYEISQLFLSARRGDFMLAIGKFVTPFGRAYFPIFENSREDAPFIRTESILWRETGLLLQYGPGISAISLGLVNGGIDRDTNSSKALIARIGIGRDDFATGVSIKWHDGIGSEHQKLRGNHLGADAMYRIGRWQFSGEVIYDQYGFRKQGTNIDGDPFSADDITWGRSLYYRELLLASGNPLTGIGYYVNLNIDMDSWLLMLNYGEYYPKQIGDRLHDEINRRGIVKLIYRFLPGFESYTMVLRENDVAGAQSGSLRRGISILSGFQFML